uniref:NADH dehydrogenase [ubiquinone] 1 alpha subcomplex assembly factor 4 n=1 Tax=Sphenodon punctatus TaxID=8508 RepID=A0A8D0H7L7_SPHPU
MMGARLARPFQNFNLESRAHREISKQKPLPAPRHALGMQDSQAENRGNIHKKDAHLLTLLKGVYVDSKDPSVHAKYEGRSLLGKQEERRLVQPSPLADLDVQTVPKGKISIVEALTLLNNHQLHPQTWTAEKIAREYNLELKEVSSLLEHFIPFTMEIFSPKDVKVVTPK